MPALRLDGLRRIAVLRALMLGDLICATPALRALRHACPNAEITLIGLPWAAEFASRLESVDTFRAFPGHPGLPEREADLSQWPAFMQWMLDQRFDLAVQLHGSGDIVNSLLGLSGARHTAAFSARGCWAPDPELTVPWPEQGTEIERLLRLTDHLGAPRVGMHLDFPVGEEERRAVAERWPQLQSDRPYVCVHAGSQLPSRRWPAERFAEVADALAEQGCTIVLTGAASESAIVEEVRRAMHAPALDACGRTTLFELGALIERASLVVCNDTGLSHIAAALQVPSVVVSSGADVRRWSPLDAERHRMLAHDVPCRPCAFRVCPYGHECALGVPALDVAGVAVELLAQKKLACNS